MQHEAPATLPYSCHLAFAGSPKVCRKKEGGKHWWLMAGSDVLGIRKPTPYSQLQGHKHGRVGE